MIPAMMAAAIFRRPSTLRPRVFLGKKTPRSLRAAPKGMAQINETKPPEAFSTQKNSAFPRQKNLGRGCAVGVHASTTERKALQSAQGQIPGAAEVALGSIAARRVDSKQTSVRKKNERATASRVDHRARARHAQRTIPLRMRRCGDRTTARAIFTTTAVATHAPRAPTLWQAPSGGRSLGPRRSSGTCGPSSQQAACERPTRTVVAAGVHVTMGALFRNLLNARRPCSLHAHIAYSLRFTSSRHHSVSCGAI